MSNEAKGHAAPPKETAMIVVMKGTATVKEIGAVIKAIEDHGFRPHVSKGEERTIIGVIGNERKVEPATFEGLPGVDRVIPILKPFKLASREFKAEDTIVDVEGVPIGGREIIVMAGPCAVETQEQVMATAKHVKACGARILRGGAYKPRTSPYAFQGLGHEGIEFLVNARKETGLKIVTEILSTNELDYMMRFADILQVGARNMQNFTLLEELGKVNKPILLKRGMMSTLEELLMSAEYILSKGNYHVMLCERGIRTFERYTRNTLDISAVPVLKRLSHLPVIVDPSHAAGERAPIPALARAAVAAGADGLIIEVHPTPEKALCDGPQSLHFHEFEALMAQIRPVAVAIGRTV